MPSVLFVCTKNECPSPIAAALFKNYLVHAGMGDEWRVDSAGTWAEPNHPASLLSQKVMRELGGGLGNHRSKRVTAEYLREFDLILVMERGQLEALKVEFPDLEERVFLLTALVGPSYDLLEPEEQTLEAYRALVDEITYLISKASEKVVSLV
jgi:protein-tyrosine-phosphatase